MSYVGVIKIPVLFDMSGDTIVFAEEVSGDFVSSHLDFLLDMTTEANDISLNAADISSSILIGDQDTGDNIFYSGGATSNIAVDNLCNRIAKAITRGKLVHIPKSGDSSNSGIPMGGRANLVNSEGELGSSYATKYLTSIAPIGDEQMLGQAMARVASIHLVGSPLPAGIFEDKNEIQNELETASAQTFNSGNTAFYNALAVQLSKVLGGSKSSAPMNPAGDLIIAYSTPGSAAYDINKAVTSRLDATGESALVTNANLIASVKTVTGNANATLSSTVQVIAANHPNAENFPRGYFVGANMNSATNNIYEPFWNESTTTTAVGMSIGFTYDDGSHYGFAVIQELTPPQPLDASGVSVPALKSIYEQLMNVPGRSQIMETKDVGGAVDNSNITVAGGFPFITGDKLVMYLRPKIVFAAQTKAEQSTSLVGFAEDATLAAPVYDIGLKSSAGGSISGQVYTNSSSHDNNDTYGFHTLFEDDDATNWTTAGDTNHQYSTSSPFDYIGDRKTINIGETKNITVTTARLQNDNQIVDTEDGFIYGIGFVNRLNIQAGDTVTYEHPTLGSQTTTVSQVNTGGAAPSKPYLIILTDNHNITVGTPINSCTFHNKKEGVVGEWGQIDIGQNTVINKFQIWPRDSYRDSRSPSDFNLLGSLDGTNWTIIKTVTGLTVSDWATNNGNTPAGTNTWELSSVHGPYRYYRLSVQSRVGVGDGRLSLTGLKLYGVKSPSEVANAGSSGNVTDISGLQTNIVATAENIEDAFPGNATSGPEPEINKWGWMGSTYSDSLTLETTDVNNVRTLDLHIWKITITL